MGYDRHRVVEKGVTFSDLAVFGMEYLLEKNLLNSDEIGALISVTETLDYIGMPTSNIIQGRLDLSEDVFCADIIQGCAGYIIGLQTAFSLLEKFENKKVVLISGTFASAVLYQGDKSSYPMAGDAVSITIVENSDAGEKIHGEVKNDGKHYDAIIAPAGGLRMPYSAETAIIREDEQGNRRSLNHSVMNGKEIFSLVQNNVPKLINDLIDRVGLEKSDIDYFLFHQPNKFIVEQLATYLEIPSDKYFSNIASIFGNSSSATIPLSIAYNIGERMLDEKFKVCFAAFGAGLTWGVAVMEIGNFNCCKILEF